MRDRTDRTKSGPLLAEGLRCDKKWVRRSIFKYFHRILTLICILNHAITISSAFEDSCDVFKIIFKIIEAFLRLTAPTKLYLKVCRLAKTRRVSQFSVIFTIFCFEKGSLARATRFFLLRKILNYIDPRPNYQILK